MPKGVILIVLDSAGVSELPDAAVYRDEGANTIGHILIQWALLFLFPIWQNWDYISF
ncbi:MAG: hypothetical protein LBS81_02375 [Endomicrobium sp.]|jgi:phosphopentomutase|nr:hypothetical protein [Endomicrobium sp.]